MGNPPDFTTTYFPIIIATFTGLVGAGLGIYNFIQGQRDRKPKFELFQRKQESGVWFIHLHSPSKAIRECNVTFKGKPLLLRGGQGYKKTIMSGGGCNFDMPRDILDNDDGIIQVKSGRMTIEKARFNEMESE